MNELLLRRAKAVALAGGLVCWSFTADLDHRWRQHPAVPAGVGSALALAVRAPLGLRPPAVWPGVRLGLACAGAVTAGVAASIAVPAVRTAMLARELPDSPVRWLALEIPLGTIWSEEAAYRAALGTVSAAAFGPVWGRLLQSLAFGLSHIPDARAAGEPVAGTVLVTGASGWLFDWLQTRSGSVTAPLLAHLAINEAGALAALAVQFPRASRRKTDPKSGF